MITHQSGRVRSAPAWGLRACVAVMVVAVLAKVNNVLHH